MIMKHGIPTTFKGALSNKVTKAKEFFKKIENALRKEIKPKLVHFWEN